MKKIVPSQKRDKEQLAKEYYEAIISEFRCEKKSEKIYKYEIMLQGVKFTTVISNDELLESARLAIEILEVLREINANKLSRAECDKIVAEASETVTEDWAIMALWEHLDTPSMNNLIIKSGRVQRVAGAWALLIAGPMLRNAICVVFEQIVDRFDDDKIYELSGYFLLRAVLRMRGKEVE